MTTPSDGGPAFPITASPSTNASKGMSLRDYFAGQAVVGMLACPMAIYKDLPKDAYSIANAMLVEREK